MKSGVEGFGAPTSHGVPTLCWLQAAQLRTAQGTELAALK